MRRGSGAVVLVALGILGAGGSAAAGSPSANVAAVRDCKLTAGPTISISSVRNMSCRAARRDIRRHDGPIYRRFRTPGGFRCRRVSGNQYGGQWRCVKGSKAYRFEFGD